MQIEMRVGTAMATYFLFVWRQRARSLSETAEAALT